MFAYAPTSHGVHHDCVPVDACAAAQALQWLRVRRTYAFDSSEALAQKHVVSADAYLCLYQHLVLLCNAGAGCCAELKWLAERRSTSRGTPKRWMEERFNVALIRHQPRPDVRTTLTIIPALDDYDSRQRTSAPEAPVDQPTSNLNRILTACATGPLFLGPEQWIDGHPAESQALILQSIKSKRHKQNCVVCGANHGNDQPSSRELDLTEGQ